MKILSEEEWRARVSVHQALVSPIADAFLLRRGRGIKHPVYDFLFTYYSFSPNKLKEWVPSFEEGVRGDGFSAYWFKTEEGVVRLNRERLHGQAVALVSFVEELCRGVLERTPRFGCFGLHEWAMVYKMSNQELRHTGYSLRLDPKDLARFVESQNLCCTHYDAYRFFTPEAKPLNAYNPELGTRQQFEQAGCLHANMDIYKWAAKLWPWIGSDFIARAFLNAVKGRELDMRASPYDLSLHGYIPIKIETEEGRREYQAYQAQYARETTGLREELADFCKRLKEWKNDCVCL